PRAFVRGAMSEQVEQLLAVFDEVRPEVVVTYDPNGGYGHPDHIRAHRVATAAVERSEGVRRLFYTVSSREATTRGLAALRRDERVPFRVPADEELPTTPDADITTRVDISAYREVKFAALRAHRTQITVGPDCFALSNGIDERRPTPPDADTAPRVGTSAYREVTSAALRAHRTQITVGRDCLALSNGIGQPVPTTEFFVLARGPKEGADTDLSGGL